MKKWFENLKISKKLIFGFLVISFIGIVIGTVGIFNINNITNSQQETYDQCTLGIRDSSKAEVNFMALGKTMSALLINYDDINVREQNIEKCEEYINAIDSALEEYSKTIASDEDQKNFDSTKAAYEAYLEIMNSNLSVAKSGGSSDQLLANMSQATTIAQEADNAFDFLTEYNNNLAKENLVSERASATMAIVIMIVITAISFLISLRLGFYISGTISTPMQRFASFADLLAVGDIDVGKVTEEKDRLWALRKDEVGLLASSFDKMIASTKEQAQQMRAIADGDLTTAVTVRSEFDILGQALSELVSKFHALAVSIVSSANQVDSGAKQVADSSTELSQGAIEQASSVEELSASMEEITSQTTQNAQNAQRSNELGKSIQKDADVSNAQMAEMLRAMEEINASSDNIRKIIKVIEDIAFQTNILALNAAVEAARAGQYGKGFAVVAEEVRNLAGQSSKAAKETTELIKNSIEKVGAGTRIANETSAALSKIMAEVSQAAELINSIASASSEQATALEQINQGITGISQVVQTNAAAAEESAAASEELSSQADCLKQNVSVFKLNAGRVTSSQNDFKPQASKSEASPQKRKKEDQNKQEEKSKSKVRISLSDDDFGKY